MRSLAPTFFIFLLTLATIVSCQSPANKTVETSPPISDEAIQRLREFPPTTMQEHLKSLSPNELATEKIPFIFDSRAISWSFKLKFLGEIRPIKNNRKKLLKSIGAKKDQKLADLYSDEIFVSDGSENFWLPVQTPVLFDFKTEVKKDDQFLAETRYFGSFYENTAQQFFIMIDFAQIPKN